MLRDHLQSLVESAVDRLVSAERLPEVVRRLPVEISDTKNPEHGDYACNFALVASKPAGMNPRQVGELLREELLAPSSTPFAAIDIAGPGFLNFKLQPDAISGYLSVVLEQGAAYARSSTARPQRVNVEFVSVNPNGPITVGSGRGAAFGDTLSRVLEAAGNAVEREYYINDGVNSEQMKLFAESVRALALGNPLPEKGYKGEYVADIAERLVNPDTPDLLAIDRSLNEALANLEHALQGETSVGYRSDRLAELRTTFLSARDQLRAEIEARDFGSVASEVTEGLALGEDAQAALREAVENMSTEQIQQSVQKWMVERQRGDLQVFGVEFERWFSEQTLHDEGKVAEAMRKLEEAGNAYRAVQPRDLEETGGDEEEPATGGEALWLASHTGGFGDDKDRVLVRGDGRPAYIAADVAYLEDKLGTRSYDKAFLILGPDHHGYIGRMYSAYQALGYPLNEKGKPEKFEIVIFQIVRFMKDGKPAPMRKRDGNIYELRDLVEELGKAQAPNASIEEQRRIGADVARFFYLMRSHDTHMDFDIDLATKQSDENPVFYVQYAHARICSVIRKAQETLGAIGGANPSLLTHPRELSLIKKILDLPTEVQRCAKDYGIHRLTTFAVELARTYHHFYDACRVIQPEQPELSAARIALCEAARTALQATLGLLGVSAPERMDRAAAAE